MNRLSFVLFALAILLIGGGAAWYLVDSRNDAFGTQHTPTIIPDVTVGQAIYTNGTHGFTVFYPENATVDYTFDATYHVGTQWRVNALPEGTGTPLVSFVTYAHESDISYPRYFYAMVRIGASDDPKELARCTHVAKDEGETELADVTINGMIWKAFSFESAGMMQYARGTSYRTEFEGKCIALEKVRTGSSYREEASPNDISDSVLDAEYGKLDRIIESFTFAR